MLAVLRDTNGRGEGRHAEGGGARGGGEDEGLAFDLDDDQYVRTAHGDEDGDERERERDKQALSDTLG